jgi:hypothetical protein
LFILQIISILYAFFEQKLATAVTIITGRIRSYSFVNSMARKDAVIGALIKALNSPAAPTTAYNDGENKPVAPNLVAPKWVNTPSDDPAKNDGATKPPTNPDA